MAFGLPYVLTVSKPVQAAKGHRAGAGNLSSYVAAAERGVPAILAEAGGIGQLQEDAVAVLVDGVVRVMRHMGMMEDGGDATAKLQTPSAKFQRSSKSQASKEDRRSSSFAQLRRDKQTVATENAKLAASPTEDAEEPKMLTAFEWVYAENAGMWYSRVAAGDVVQKGQEIGAIGSLFGDTLETVTAPVTGTVLFLTVNPSVQENGLLMGIGVE
jgi:predicted deacylase